MNITEDALRQIVRDEITAVLTDLGMLLPLPLDAEPAPLVEGNQTDKIIKVLKRIGNERRTEIFNRFGFYSRSQLSGEITKNVLTNISNINQAQKGNYTAQ